MKKHLSLVLRILVAALGVGYVIWMVDLSDRVEAPAGVVLPDGSMLEEARALKVVGGVYDPTNPAGELVVEVRVGTGRLETVTIPRASLGKKKDEMRFVPGLVTMLRGANVGLLIAGLVVVGLIYPILVVRWWWLMRTRGMAVRLSKAFRLTMVGNFFNFCIPGTTGGDVVKAYYAAKGSGRRADAVMTVILDRICGLLGLLVLAGFAGLFMWGDETARQLTVYIWLIMGGAVVGATLYFSQTLRSKLGINWLLEKLPGQGFLEAIDQAALAYRHHKMVLLGAIAASVFLHIAIVSATTMAGYALGMRTPVSLLLIVIPVSFLVGAIPISPQGIGVMEFFAITMLQSPLAFPNQIVGMLIMIRLYQIFYSLLGSLFLLKGDIHLHPQEAVVPLDSEPTGEQVAAP